MAVSAHGESFKGAWLIADMDGTITPTPSKAHGHYLPLSASPCLAPLEHFIRQGGDVCVVSTAGRRMWRQVFEVLKPTLFAAPTAGRLFICGFSGAALFTSCFKRQTMIEDETYRHSALKGGCTVLPPAHLQTLEKLVQAALFRSYNRMHHEEGFLELLSRKYHAPMRSLLHQIFDVRKESLETTPLLSLDNMKRHGLYLTETNDALMDIQVIPTSDGSVPEHEDVAVQVTALGVPMARAHEIFTVDVMDALKALGVTAKFQPNSVVIAKDSLDKGTCIAYLKQTHGLDLRRAIAFGDIPASIDRPLTMFPPMPFVSVSLTPETDPPGSLSVGGEEVGTAMFLTAWMAQRREQRELDAMFSPECLAAAVAQAKSLLAQQQPAEGTIPSLL